MALLAPLALFWNSQTQVQVPRLGLLSYKYLPEVVNFIHLIHFIYNHYSFRCPNFPIFGHWEPLQTTFKSINLRKLLCFLIE